MIFAAFFKGDSTCTFAAKMPVIFLLEKILEVLLEEHELNRLPNRLVNYKLLSLINPYTCFTCIWIYSLHMPHKHMQAYDQYLHIKLWRQSAKKHDNIMFSMLFVSF